LVAARAHVAAGLETLQTKLDTLESGIAARTAERITLQEQLSTLRDTEDRQARQLLELRLFIRAVQQLVHGPAPLGQTALPTLGDTLRRLFALLVSPQ
jgi:chromosome segregation ATPase